MKEPPVFELIQHLDRAEKGYFNKFSKMLGKGDNYLILFNILSDMDRYDKEVVIKKLRKRKKNIANLSVSLHHLYHLILKSLRLFHEKNYYKIQINGILSEVEILLGKNLRKQAIKLLDKAEQLAISHQLLPTLLEIQKIQITQKVATVKTNLLGEIKQSYNTIEKTAKIFTEELQYRKLHHFAFTCYRINSQDADHNHSQTLRFIAEHPFMESTSISEDSSFYSRYYRNSTKSTEALIYANREAAHLYYKNILKIWEEHPAMIKAEPILYRNNLSNYLINAIFIKKIDNFDSIIKKLEQIPTRFLNDQIELFQSKIYLEQLYHLNNKDLDNAYVLISKHTYNIEKYASKMNFSRLVIIRYNFLITCFLLGKFQEALTWNNIILNHKNADPKKDIRLFCRIMELILHYELGHYDLMDSLFTSIWRKRKAESSFFHYTEMILSHFKKLIKIPSLIEKNRQYELFYQDLDQLRKDKPESIGIEELSIWVKAKKENKSIKDIYKEK